MSDYTEEEPDDYVFYGTSLDPLEEDEVTSKKPIRIEDQIVTDINGKRRFHGAFTGGFSAGYWNTVGSKEGWRPAEFKSSRSDRKTLQQKPQDFMDEEDLGSFGIAPQVLRAKDDFGENHASKKRLRPVFAPSGPIPGLPALHSILNPIRETIGVKLLRSMGWKPNQGVGERVTKREKRERNRKAKKLKSYGCPLPPGLQTSKQASDGDEESDSDEDSEHLFAPDDVPAFTVKPKDNTFGLGYSGLMPRSESSTSRSHFVLFEPTLSVVDRRKKLQIAGQAFGVGAFEKEDVDIYAKDDMSQYDFELGPVKKEKKTSKRLALPAPDLLDGFVRATKADPVVASFKLPDVPRDWVPIHRNRKSRFDVKPRSQSEVEGLGRHDLNALQRGAILEEVLDISVTRSVATAQAVTTTSVTEPEDAQRKIDRLDFDSFLSEIKMKVSLQKSAPAAAAKVPIAPDPEREAKRAALRKFVESSKSGSSFQPFARDPEKQFRFDAFAVLSKSGRMGEFPLVYADSTSEWEREREKVEFERAQELYRPLCGMMQNRFTSGGQIEENIEGGLVAEVHSLTAKETVVKPQKIEEKDPAKRAALRKHFGPLTRQRCQWKPDRLLCIRFNVPNPFPESGGPSNAAAGPSKGLARKSGQKFSIFDVLDVSTPPSTSVIIREDVPAGASQVRELEWNKAERGELEEKEEAPVVEENRVTVKEEEARVEEEEEEVYERPPMDLFKAIFAESESEEDEKVDDVAPEATTTLTGAPSQINEQLEPEQPKQPEEMEEDVYGPRQGPKGEAHKRVFVAEEATGADDDDWVEKDRMAKKSKKEKKKKKKKKKKMTESDKTKKKDKRKDKKSKKRSRRSSDSSSSGSDSDDEVLLRKLVELKKKQML